MKKTYRVNVRNAKYAPVTANTTTDYTLGEAKETPGLMTADLQFDLATGRLYGDGSLKANIAQIVGATMRIGLNKLDLDDRCTIMGHDYTDAVASISAGDAAPLMAWYFEIESSTGEKEQIWLLAGNAQPAAITGRQREDNIQFATDEITIGFVAIEKTGNVIRMVDTADDKVTPEKSAAFAAAPYTAA